MGQALVHEARDLSDGPLEAAAKFHATHLPMIEEEIVGGPASVTIVFGPGDHEQRDWRLAAIRNLARKHAPIRVNGVAGAGDSVKPLLTYLENAPGVTGQLLDAA